MLPLLILLFGIIEFGRIYFVQLSLTNAARDAARSVAISDDEGALDDSLSAAPGIRFESGALPIVDPVDGCATAGTVRVSVSITQTESVLGIVNGPGGDPLIPITLTGRAVTVCGG